MGSGESQIMARKDLLSLTEDDLVLLSNRGTVKRCVREIEENEFTAEITEDEQGNVQCDWSDGAKCMLAASKALGPAQCSCPATTVCRHLVRSVLAYQRWIHLQSSAVSSPGESTSKPPMVAEPLLEHDSDFSKSSQPEATDSADQSCECGDSPRERRLPAGSEKPTTVESQEAPDGLGTAPQLESPSSNNRSRPDADAPGSDTPETEYTTPGNLWNPGDMTDEAMAKQINPMILKRARKMFDAGQVVELITGPKPLARFFTVPASVRFLVEGDCRYTYCNCAEETPCVHVPLAIYAFRLLSGRSAGIVGTAENKSAAPALLLAELDALLMEFASLGLAGVAPAVATRFQKVRQKCDDHGLRWSAELLSELLEEQNRYHSADALFSPEKVVDIVGELCARHDALAIGTKAVPTVFITGSSSDRPTDQSSLRLIGLGCGVEARKHSSVVTAFFQDDDSGYLVGIQRQFNRQDPAEDNRSFAQLATSALVRGHSLSNLAAGQLLCKGGKLTTSRNFIAGRTTPMALNPQQYNWERLRFPVLVENLNELRTLLAFQPPRYLGSRHQGRNLHVCPVNRIEDVRFSTAHQALVATVIDPAGRRCTLYHPYTSRGKAGIETTLRHLRDPALRPIFIAGMFTTKASGICVRPISIVVQHGASRRLIQPWVDAPSSPPVTKADSESQAFTEEPTIHPLQSFSAALEDALSEILIEGVERYSDHTVATWRNLADQSTQLGFTHIAQGIHRFFKALESQRHDPNWTAKRACQLLLDVCVIHIVMREAVFDALAPAQ